MNRLIVHYRFDYKSIRFNFLRVTSLTTSNIHGTPLSESNGKNNNLGNSFFLVENQSIILL
jgi:hypothetical protein